MCHQSAQAPILESPRLTLRPHTLADFDQSAALWSDPRVTRFIGGKPLTREETWTRFLRYAGHWLLLGFGYWVAEEKATGRFLGELGFADYKRDIQPSLEGLPEAGWVFAPAAHGQGYATEAVLAITHWADRHFESPRTACIISPENAASIHVAAKCGYREAHRTVYHGSEALIFFRN